MLRAAVMILPLSRHAVLQKSLTMGVNIIASASVARTNPPRLDSIDLVRGAVMIIMALDHVRDFFSERFYLDPVDVSTTTPAYFLTRWITHFCAPTFIFLAGTSAFLAGQRGRSKPALSWLLFTRGLWLAFFEVVINRWMWMFNFDFHRHGAGVFWAIGWSMVALSALVFLPTRLVTAFGLLMIVLHNLLDDLTPEQVGLPGWLWMIMHSPAEELPVYDEFTFSTGYCLVPWIGVMAAGYGFGSLWQLDRPVRRRRLLQLGAALTLGFIVLRAANVYGDPKPWSTQTSPLLTCLSFLNCTKYPPSLLYLLMTLGPAILALAIFDRPLGPLAEPIVTFGRVPLFFYLLHIPLIHGGAVLLDCARFGWSPLAAAGPWELDPSTVPASYGVNLPMVYAIWIVVIFLLYPPCHWFAGVKRRRHNVWLTYF
jgi:uncharacterized membrane protein